MKKILFLLIAALFYTGALHAQVKPALESTPLTNKQSILNGKVYFNFPKTAVNIARNNGIMSADVNENEETRIIFDQGNQRMVFFAKELYSLSNRDMFLLTLKQNEEQYKFTKKILTDKDSLLSIISTPSKFDAKQKAILVNSLLVVTPDHSVFRIDAFINPEAFAGRSSYQKLSEQVFATLSKGMKRVNLLPRKEVFPIAGTKKAFEVILPAGYTVTKDSKADFQVLKFHKYLSVLDTVWLALTVYTGNHPSYFYSDYGFTEAQAVKAKTPLLGKETEWLLFDNKNKGLILKEQQVRADDIEKDLIIHVAMLSNSPSLMTELSRIVAVMKVID